MGGGLAAQKAHGKADSGPARGLFHSRWGIAVSLCHVIQRTRQKGPVTGKEAFRVGATSGAPNTSPQAVGWEDPQPGRMLPGPGDHAPSPEGKGKWAAGSQGRMVCAQEAAGEDRVVRGRAALLGALGCSPWSRACPSGAPQRAKPRHPGLATWPDEHVCPGCWGGHWGLPAQGSGRHKGPSSPSHGPSGAGGYRCGVAREPYGRVLPSFGRTVTPLVSSRISHMSINFFMLRKLDTVCLPVGGKQHSYIMSSSGCLGQLRPPAQPTVPPMP